MKEIEPHWVSGKGGYHSEGVRGHEAYQRVEESWVPLPTDVNRAKQLIAERFYDPMNLRTIPIEEPIEDLQSKAKSPMRLVELLTQRIFGSSV